MIIDVAETQTMNNDNLSELYENYKTNIVILMNTDDESSELLIKKELERAQKTLFALILNELVKYQLIFKNICLEIQRGQKNYVKVIEVDNVVEFINYHLALECQEDFNYDTIIINEKMLDNLIASSKKVVPISIYEEYNLKTYLDAVMANVDMIIENMNNKLNETRESILSECNNRVEYGVLALKTLVFIFVECSIFYKSASEILRKVIID